MKKAKTPEAYLRRKYLSLRDARKRQTPEIVWEITADDLVNLWHKQNGRCAVTNLHMTNFADGGWTNCSPDRIDNEGGYTPDNLRLVCYSVNRMKSTMTESEFEFWVKSIASGITNDG
jgi:hypothetical protein